MYNVNNSEVVYLYDYALGGYTQKFPSYDDLLKFLASVSYYDTWEKRVRNEYLDNLNITGNDVVSYHVPFSSGTDVYLRRYLFIGEDDKVFDPRNDMKTIQYYYENKIIDYKVCWETKRKHSRWRHAYKPNVEYRYDPMPYIGSHRSHTGRKCSIMNEARKNADPEMEEFVRAKRNNTRMFNVMWDADWRSRCRSRSWKDCSHRRHQYKD